MKFSSEEARKRRKKRIQKKIFGTQERPRLVVFRSNAHIYAQVINDLSGETIASVSSLTLAKDNADMKLNKETATKVGKAIAELAKEANVEQVVFDRNGYIYHGRIKALADGAREGGLTF